MSSPLRSAPTWWTIELYGSDAERRAWLCAARREGHRLAETVDGGGRCVTAVMVLAPDQVGQLTRLFHQQHVAGSLRPMA